MKVRSSVVSVLIGVVLLPQGALAQMGSGGLPPPPDGTPTAAAAPAPVTPPSDPWPRDITLSNADALIYQPQIESWVGNQLK